MNVCDTMSHVDKHVCQIQYANVKAKKVMGRTRICRDRWTDRWTDSDSCIPPDLHSQGVKLL